jgi:alpha-mannosidase
VGRRPPEITWACTACWMSTCPRVNLHPPGFAWKRLLRERAGVDPRCAWTIDSFGHHRRSPTHARCGFDHAVFQRLMEKGSRSEFIWQGLDGTRLLCHWMPALCDLLWRLQIRSSFPILPRSGSTC